MIPIILRLGVLCWLIYRVGQWRLGGTGLLVDSGLVKDMSHKRGGFSATSKPGWVRPWQDV